MSTRRTSSFVLLLSAFFALSIPSRAGQVPLWDKITIGATINGKRVHLIFDTGSQQTALFHATAQRLGLKLLPSDANLPPPPPGKVRANISEPVSVTFGTSSRPVTRPFCVIDAPSYLHEVDGVISWIDADTATDSGRVTLVDIGRGFVDAIPMPRDLDGWTKWKLVQNTPFLEFESLSTADGEKPVRIGIDTGDNGGLLLNTPRWREWRAARAGAAGTIEASWYPADGLIYNEILRARSVTLGALTLPDVPVRLMEPSGEIGFRQPDAILGTFALRRLKLIIDRKNGVLYIRRVVNDSDEYPYNRLGAVFLPADPSQGGDLIARVAQGSPAHAAGIRDGDILLKVDDTSMTNWATDIRLHRAWDETPGTQVKFLIKRGENTREITVTLQQPIATE